MMHPSFFIIIKIFADYDLARTDQIIAKLLNNTMISEHLRRVVALIRANIRSPA